PVLAALRRLTDDSPARLYAFSSGAFAVVPEDQSSAGSSVVPGPVRVLPKELPGLTAVHVDLDGDASMQEISSTVLSQLRCEPDARGVLAVRASKSYARTVKPADAEPGSTLLRRRGTYVLTGGLGGVALSLAQELALRLGANFVLLSRSPFPPATEWSRILGEDPGSKTAKRIRALR